jgi:hypothetical protein
VVQKGRPSPGREHVVGAGREARSPLVCSQHGGELWEERDLALRGGRLRRHPVRSHAAAAARELMANVDHRGGEIDVMPAQREQLGEAQAGEGSGGEQGPVPLRAGAEQASELALAEHALLALRRVRALVAFEPPERMRADVAAP